MAKKSKTELDYQLKGKRIDAAAHVAGQLVRWGSITAIVYFVCSALIAFAGKTTFADVGIRLLAQLNVSDWFWVVLGGGGLGYGLRQRTLRRDTIESLSPRVREREEKLDPGRTSSQLGPRGTPMKDK